MSLIGDLSSLVFLSSEPVESFLLLLLLPAAGDTLPRLDGGRGERRDRFLSDLSGDPESNLFREESERMKHWNGFTNNKGYGICIQWTEALISQYV